VVVVRRRSAQAVTALIRAMGFLAEHRRSVSAFVRAGKSLCRAPVPKRSSSPVATRSAPVGNFAVQAGVPGCRAVIVVDSVKEGHSLRAEESAFRFLTQGPTGARRREGAACSECARPAGLWAQALTRPTPRLAPPLDQRHAYMERFIQSRAISRWQVLGGDPPCKLIHLGERDFRFSGRIRRIVEEGPATALVRRGDSPGMAAGRTLALAALGQLPEGCGHVEFIFESAERGRFYSLSVNTPYFQVEASTVTELLLTGIDSVAQQAAHCAGAETVGTGSGTGRCV